MSTSVGPTRSSKSWTTSAVDELLGGHGLNRAARRATRAVGVSGLTVYLPIGGAL